MSSVDTYSHVRAESPYIDDLPEPLGMLYAAVLSSPVAHGKIKNLEIKDARDLPGVAQVFTAEDIPGENQIGGIIQDEPLLAEKAVHNIGQPIAFVVADSIRKAHAARDLIKIKFEELPCILDPREAAKKGNLIAPARSLSCGNLDEAWKNCTTIVKGRADSGGQEHLYLETQASLAIPQSRGRLLLYAGTQAPTSVQKAVAGVLGCKMNDIEVEVQRLGGAFGGKEDQATPWAVMASLAAKLLNKPVKLILPRGEDLRMTGKRHPYSSDYKLGLDANGKFKAFEVTYYQNSGSAADLSTSVLERTLFHATNSYFIPNVRATGLCCRTNLPPFTAFRGFGGPQAMFVIEAAITAAAQQLNIPAWQLQQNNLLHTGDELPYGMHIEKCNAERSFNCALEKFDFKKRSAELKNLNASSAYKKHGIAIMPICFGISFTNINLNQAGALVHIYNDGSVSVTTGVVEMGQGVFTKIRHIAVRTLGISEDRIRIENTNTTRVANMSPTAASTATDLNGMATQMACQLLLERLKNTAANIIKTKPENIVIKNQKVWRNGTETNLDWHRLVEKAYWTRVDLSAHALYATPRIHYDKTTEKGQPFAYHVFGTAITETIVDTLRGTAEITSIKVIHDTGKSLDLLVDRGQAEGAIIQGIGWMTLEDLVYSDKGRLLSDALATYKIPDLHFAPKDIEVHFLEDSENPHAVMQTKGIGEPPLMYGIGAYFSILNAINTVCTVPADLITAPMTNEHILELLDASESSAGFSASPAQIHQNIISIPNLIQRNNVISCNCPTLAEKHGLLTFASPHLCARQSPPTYPS